MDNGKRKAFIHKQVTERAKKRLEGVVSLTGDTAQAKPFIKRKLTDKGDRLVRKLKEVVVTTIREKVRWAKEDGKTKYCNSDGSLNELNDCYDDGFQECICQVKALYPNLDVSQVSLDNVVQTLAGTVDHEGTDEIFEANPMPNVQGKGKAAPEDEQVKSIRDKTRTIGEEGEPAGHEQVVNEETPVDQPQQFYELVSLFSLYKEILVENDVYVMF